MTIRPITLPAGYKFKDGKIYLDDKVVEAKLPVNKRIARRKSKKVKVSRNPRPKGE